MVDQKKHAEYWKAGAIEDWEVAEKLIVDGKIRHGLFFAHLALEKMLKALFTIHTTDIAPRIHNLIRLAELGHLELDEDHMNLLADMNQFNLEGRYPETILSAPEKEEALEYLNRSKRVMEWLSNQF